MKAFLISVILAILIFIAVYAYQAGTAVAPTTPGPGTVACTLEARLCPDGSYVGRQGPNCEFAACPGESK